MEATYSEAALASVARKLLDAFSTTKVWLFRAEMGAGKTTLIKQLCRMLDVSDELSSPTFSIINQYQAATGSIYHFDFYRLEGIEEAVDIGAEDYFFSGDWCFIEWPELIMPLLPDNYLEISINLVNQNTRHLTTMLHGQTR